MEPNASPRAIRKPSNTESAALILFGRIVGFAISTALPLVLVWKMNQAAFGLYKGVFLVANTAINIVPLGFGMNLFYFIPRHPERKNALICNTVASMLFVGLAAGLTLVLWPESLMLLSKEREIVPLAPLIGLMIVPWIVGSLFEIVPIVNQEFRLAMGVPIVNQLFRALAFLTAAVMFGSVQALTWAGVGYSMVLAASLLYYLAKRFPGFWREFDLSLLKNQFSYALPMGAMGLIWYFQSDLHNYFVFKQYGSELFAIYSIGCFQLPLVQLLCDAAGSVLITQVAQLREQKDTEQIIFLTLRATRKLAAALFPSYAFLMVMGHEFITFLFSEKYAASWPILMVNLTIVPLSVLQFDPVVRAYPEFKYLFVKLKVASFLVLLAALWWATPRFGPIGAISSVILVMAADRAVQATVVIRILGFGRSHFGLLTDTVKLAACAAGAAAMTAGVRFTLLGARSGVLLLVGAAVFGISYLGLVLWQRVVSPQEKVMIKQAASGLGVSLRQRLRWT